MCVSGGVRKHLVGHRHLRAGSGWARVNAQYIYFILIGFSYWCCVCRGASASTLLGTDTCERAGQRVGSRRRPGLPPRPTLPMCIRQWPSGTKWRGPRELGHENRDWAVLAAVQPQLMISGVKKRYMNFPEERMVQTRRDLARWIPPGLAHTSRPSHACENAPHAPCPNEWEPTALWLTWGGVGHGESPRFLMHLRLPRLTLVMPSHANILQPPSIGPLNARPKPPSPEAAGALLAVRVARHVARSPVASVRTPRRGSEGRGASQGSSRNSADAHLQAVVRHDGGAQQVAPPPNI